LLPVYCAFHEPSQHEPLTSRAWT